MIKLTNVWNFKRTALWLDPESIESMEIGDTIENAMSLKVGTELEPARPLCPKHTFIMTKSGDYHYVQETPEEISDLFDEKRGTDERS